MKTYMYAVIVVILMPEIIAFISGAVPAQGVCFKRYSKVSGCRGRTKNYGVSSTFDDCCVGGGAGWSLKRKDRKTCTPCNRAGLKNAKGFCFNKFSKISGCRHYTLTNGRKTGTIEECCRSGGLGWTLRKADRRKCTSCDTVDTSFWGEWGKWSSCSATCGQAFQKRQRRCRNTKGKKPNCRGIGTEKKRCAKLPPCPVDGGWTDWSPWGPCSVSCGKGSKIQTRACENPKPMYGGKECQGKLENWSDCELQKHCPIPGGWGEWSSWSACSKTCDLGTKKRTRKCDSPKPQYGGKPCDVTEGVTIDYCREERCHPGPTACDERREECVSGSGSGWEMGSGSGSGESGDGSSGFGSGYGSGEGSGGVTGKRYRRSKKHPKIVDDED